MRCKYLLLCGMISTITPIFSSSISSSLTDVNADIENAFVKTSIGRLMTNQAFHNRIYNGLLEKHDLTESGGCKFVGLQCSYSKAVEAFLLALGARVLEQPTGRYLAIGAGEGYFEESATMLFPEFSQWHRTLTDCSEANLRKITNANEVRTLDVTKIEEEIAKGILQEQSFDVISIQNVFHFLSENERIRCLHNLSRLLNPNGIILLSYEHISVQRVPSNAVEDTLRELMDLGPGVYAYQYIQKIKKIHYFVNDPKTRKMGFIPLSLVLSNPVLQAHLPAEVNPDDLSVQDAIIITNENGRINVQRQRGEYPETLPKDPQIIEFAIVYKDIDFSQFPNLVIVKSEDQVKYHSVVNTRLSNIIARINVDVAVIRAQQEKRVKPTGFSFVLKKR